MNIKNIAIAFALVAATGTSLAGDRNYPPKQAADAGKSRAEVIVELQAAQAQGQIFNGDIDTTSPVATVAGKSRNDVRAELIAAVRNNELPVIVN